jgi:hypothetical protein
MFNKRVNIINKNNRDLRVITVNEDTITIKINY